MDKKTKGVGTRETNGEETIREMIETMQATKYVCLYC